MLKVFYRVGFWLLCVLPVFAQADATGELLQRLAALNTMSAQFSQLTLDANGAHMQEAQGEMAVARGNRFYWKVTKPDEQLIVANGKTVWIYDIDLEQVVIKPLETQLTDTPALLFSGNLTQIKEAFTVSELEQDENLARFLLEPKDTQALFNQLEITFLRNLPSSMRLEDSLGQKTLIDFSQVKINPTLDEQLFQFTPPDDVDVIEQQ